MKYNKWNIYLLSSGFSPDELLGYVQLSFVAPVLVESKEIEHNCVLVVPFVLRSLLSQLNESIQWTESDLFSRPKNSVSLPGALALS